MQWHEFYTDAWWFWSTLIGWVFYGKIPDFGFQLLVYLTGALMVLGVIITLYRSWRFRIGK
jgi:hypothetical protein